MQTPNKQQNWKKNIARPESGVEATSKPKFFEVKEEYIFDTAAATLQFSPSASWS
ncbi:hypothetical protein LJR235_002025 [Pararhizobium sp. LjRoot235]|uniref:hypothetical protein n=1 Tax=Pararhizobium sp. LjRoot235 TaxID=3342291 RepID=UPI003ECC2DCD